MVGWTWQEYKLHLRFNAEAVTLTELQISLLEFSLEFFENTLFHRLHKDCIRETVLVLNPFEI